MAVRYSTSDISKSTELLAHAPKRLWARRTQGQTSFSSGMIMWGLCSFQYHEIKLCQTPALYPQPQKSLSPIPSIPQASILPSQSFSLNPSPLFLPLPSPPSILPLNPHPYLSPQHRSPLYIQPASYANTIKNPTEQILQITQGEDGLFGSVG